MNSREIILQRLRSAPWLRSTTSQAVISNSNHMAAGKAQTFINQARAAGASVEEASNLAAVQDRIAELINKANLKKIIISNDEVAGQIDWQQLAGQNQCTVRSPVSLSRDDYRRYVAEADLGITGCTYALAETGTLVLEHCHDNERLISHAPNHYVCIVEKEQILRNRFDLALALNGDLPKAAAYTLITGVSRTADVAMQVVLGMHGPRKVTIFIVG